MKKVYWEKAAEKLSGDMFWKFASVVVFAAANIMYLILALGKTFHYDEAYSIGMIYNSFGEIIDITSQDVHTPFYYFLLKLFCMIPGLNVFVGSKIFSWLFMIAFLVLGGAIVRKRYGWQVTFYWILLASFMPSMMIQATTVRMYTIGLFFVTAASYLAYSIYQQESAKKWILFTVASVVAVYIHTFCMLEMVVVYGLLILMSLVKKKYKLTGKTFLSGGVVSICFLPWLFTLWKQFSRWAGWESGWTSAIEPVTLETSIVYLSEWFSSIERPRPLAVIFAVALLIYISYYARRYVERSKDYLPYMSLLIIGIILITAILISIYVVTCFMGRYVLPLFAGVWLFVAIGICETKNYIKQAVIALLIILFGLSSFKDEVKLEDSTGLEGYQQYVELNADFSEDVFMTDRYFTMIMSIYYPEADYMVYGYAPEGFPFKDAEVFMEWEQLEGVDTVYLLSFADAQGANLSAQFDVVESFSFDYSYYKMKIEKWVRSEAKSQ